MELLTPREKKTQEVKDHVLDVTGNLLKTYDFRFLTLKNISSATGVSTGSLYHHFKSKEHLLAEYGSRIYLQMLEENPVPSYVSPHDFVRCISWPLIVYCCFCEHMGKEFIKYLYQDGDNDIFYITYFSKIKDIFETAIDDGYLEWKTDRSEVSKALEDIECIYSGCVLSWCNVKSKNRQSPLYVIMERLLFKLLHSFRSAKYKEEFPGTNMTAEMFYTDHLEDITKMLP